MNETSPTDLDIPPVRKPTVSPFRRRVKRILASLAVLLVILLVAGWWNVLRIQMGDHWPPPSDAVTSAQAEAMTEAFAARSNPKRDDIAIDYASSTASDVQLYDGGAAFFPAMLTDIEQARSSIHISIFAFSPGDWGDRFAATLIERAHEGIEVRLTVDRHGSSIAGRSEAMFDEMAAAGIEIVVNDVFPIQASGTLPDRDRTWSQDEVGQSDHRKLMVIDGRIGWVGGAGFEDHFFTDEFHDVFVRVEGDVVRQLQAVFLTGFRAYGGTLPAGDGALAHLFPAPDDPGDIRLSVLQNVPGGFRPATQATWALMESAQERVKILNPYLSDHRTIDRILDAAKRGVDVTVVIPAKSNNPPADAATTYRFPELLDAGVHLYEYPRIIHAKVLVADDAVIVGSLNYDAWSLYRNVELSLLIEDTDVADRVVQTFVDPALAQSAPAEVHTGTTDRIRDWFWDKLTYFL